MDEPEGKPRMSLKEALEMASHQVQNSPDWLKTIYKRNDALLEQQRVARAGEREPAK